MKKLILILSVCFLCLSAYAQHDEVNYEVFDELFKNAENYSGNILIAVNGKPVFKKCYGYANLELGVRNTVDTKFRIGSVTKQFTSMGIMILKERGKLNLEDNISKYLSDLPAAWNDITIHQLLTHTAGLIHSWELEDFRKTMMVYNSPKETIERFKNQPLLSEPGEKFHYSGLGYFILAEIIEKVSNKTYEQFLKEEIFDKLGMANTGCDEPGKIISKRASGYATDVEGVHNSTYIYMPILRGGGDLYTTLDDLLKWDAALYNNSLISEESKEMMFTPYKNNYGYGWFVMKSESYNRVWHGGNVPGFQTYIDRYPDKGILVIVLTNNKIPSRQKLGMNFIQLLQKEFGLIPEEK